MLSNEKCSKKLRIWIPSRVRKKQAHGKRNVRNTRSPGRYDQGSCIKVPSHKRQGVGGENNIQDIGRRTLAMHVTAANSERGTPGPRGGDGQPLQVRRGSWRHICGGVAVACTRG